MLDRGTDAVKLTKETLHEENLFDEGCWEQLIEQLTGRDARMAAGTKASRSSDPLIRENAAKNLNHGAKIHHKHYM